MKPNVSNDWLNKLKSELISQKLNDSSSDISLNSNPAPPSSGQGEQKTSLQDLSAEQITIPKTFNLADINMSVSAKH